MFCPFISKLPIIYSFSQAKVAKYLFFLLAVMYFKMYFLFLLEYFSSFPPCFLLPDLHALILIYVLCCIALPVFHRFGSMHFCSIISLPWMNIFPFSLTSVHYSQFYLPLFSSGAHLSSLLFGEKFTVCVAEILVNVLIFFFLIKVMKYVCKRELSY